MTKNVETNLTVEIAAPRARVYEYRLDCLHLPELNPAVTNVRRTDGGTGKPGPGSEYVCDVRLEWGETVATITIEDAVEPSLIVLDMTSAPREDLAQASGGGVHSREVARFIDTGSGGTRIEVELIVQAPDDLEEGTFELMRRHAGDPTRLELEAMKLELERS